MLISHATSFSELHSRIHCRVLTEADEAWDASRQTFNGSGSPLAPVELRSLGGALGRRTPGHGVRARLDGDYLMFAVGGVFSPEQHGEVVARPRPWPAP